MLVNPGSGKSVLTKTFTGMLEENGRVAKGTIDYRGKDLTTLRSNKIGTDSVQNCDYFPRSDDELDPINTGLEARLQKSLSSTRKISQRS